MDYQVYHRSSQHIILSLLLLPHCHPAASPHDRKYMIHRQRQGEYAGNIVALVTSPDQELEAQKVDGPEQPTVASAYEDCLLRGVDVPELFLGMEGKGDGGWGCMSMSSTWGRSIGEGSPGTSTSK